jgi:LppP/LprE lipoprotein
VRRLSALAVLALLSGCSVDVTNDDQAKTVTQPAPATVAERTVEKQAPQREQSGGDDAVPSGGSLGEAQQRVRAEGFDPVDPGTYKSGSTLRVLLGVKSGSATSYNQQAFFFVGGRYLGTDTKGVSAGIRYEGQTDDTVTLAYALYEPNDPNCCPKGGTARVRYRWNGSRLTPLDPIPPESPNASGSRR